MTITVPAYAKINLFLDICSIRENGYHNILSYMQSVSLHDEVSVKLVPSEAKNITVICDNSSIPCDKSNLAYKAAEIFPCAGEITVSIVKNIPISAGLAGGSADCAATLVALNSLTGDKLSLDELCTLGARLGADVPFCIKGGACIVEGIGEILKPIQPMPNFPIVIAKKGEGMSTPYAYKALDERFDRFEGYMPKTEMLELITSTPGTAAVLSDGLFNIFETVVEPERPYVTELKSIMIKNGAAGAMMSGSGTSVFGIFQDESDAKAAKDALVCAGAVAHVCYPR